jgi:hypothetical protein
MIHPYLSQFSSRHLFLQPPEFALFWKYLLWLLLHTLRPAVLPVGMLYNRYWGHVTAILAKKAQQEHQKLANEAMTNKVPG